MRTVTLTLANIIFIVDYALGRTISFEYLAASSIHKLEPNIVAIIDIREN